MSPPSTSLDSDPTCWHRFGIGHSELKNFKISSGPRAISCAFAFQFLSQSQVTSNSAHITLLLLLRISFIRTTITHSQNPTGVGLGPDLARHYWVDFCYGVAVGDPTSKPVLTWKHINCRRPKRRQWNICPLGQILKYIYQRNTLNTMLKNMDQSVLSLGYVPCLWYLRKYYACWFTHSKDVESNLNK